MRRAFAARSMLAQVDATADELADESTVSIHVPRFKEVRTRDVVWAWVCSWWMGTTVPERNPHTVARGKKLPKVCGIIVRAARIEHPYPADTPAGRLSVHRTLKEIWKERKDTRDLREVDFEFWQHYMVEAVFVRRPLDRHAAIAGDQIREDNRQHGVTFPPSL
jgi:hypothetical protein